MKLTGARGYVRLSSQPVTVQPGPWFSPLSWRLRNDPLRSVVERLPERAARAHASTLKSEAHDGVPFAPRATGVWRPCAANRSCPSRYLAPPEHVFASKQSLGAASEA